MSMPTRYKRWRGEGKRTVEGKAIEARPRFVV